jgi:hypothetical protein
MCACLRDLVVPGQLGGLGLVLRQVRHSKARPARRTQEHSPKSYRQPRWNQLRARAKLSVDASGAQHAVRAQAACRNMQSPLAEIGRQHRIRQYRSGRIRSPNACAYSSPLSRATAWSSASESGPWRVRFFKRRTSAPGALPREARKLGSSSMCVTPASSSGGAPPRSRSTRPAGTAGKRGAATPAPDDRTRATTTTPSTSAGGPRIVSLPCRGLPSTTKCSPRRTWGRREKSLWLHCQTLEPRKVNEA